jgi:hypothetical protein
LDSVKGMPDVRRVLRVALLITALISVPLYSRQQRPAAPEISAAELMDALTTLASAAMEGRRSGTPGNARARAWIADRIRTIGLAPFRQALELPFTFVPPLRGGAAAGAAPIQGVNVAAVCRGTAPGDRRAIVITAHYDHLGVRDRMVYYGADDNASGVAVLLALARLCRASPWRSDAIFVAFDAEELGHRGSRAFVASLPQNDRVRIGLNVNLDMVARGDKGELYAAGTRYTPSLRPVLEAVAARAPVRLLFGHESGGGRDDWTTQSDHRAFHEAGIPFVYFGVEDHPDYHRPSDTADKVSAGFFVNAAATVLDSIAALDAWLTPPSSR